MGIVKYTGPMASFHCPTNAEIRSLKVHFSPKQEGSGDPSPENVRPIVGWDGVEVYKSGKNIWDEQWENGYIIDGIEYSSSTSIRSKNYNSVVPNQTYYLYCGSATSIYFIRPIFYDINKNFISNSSWCANGTFTTPENCQYIRLTTQISIVALYGGTYKHDISVNCLSTDHEYHPYQGETTNYEFGVLGKNKVPFLVNSKTISIQTNGNDSWCNVWKIPNRKLKYTYSADIDNTNNTVAANITVWFKNIDNTSFVDGVAKSGTPVAAGTVGRSIITIDASVLSNTYYFAFGITSFIKSGETVSCTFSNPMVEIGDTATEYESYDPKNTVYGGWVDLITGEVCETHSLKTFNGSEQQWLWNQSSNGIAYIIIDSMKSGTWYSDPYTICDTAIKVNAHSSGALKCLIGYNNKSIYFYNTTTVIPNISNLDDFTNWLSTNNITITYPLDTSTTYQLAPTQLQTFLGQNNVWSNADYVEVEYDLHETQNILARKQFIIANQPHIVTPAAAPLQNFVTDVPAPLKECKVYFSPVQEGSGDPSPSNVRNISGWTGIKAYKRGKNIWDEEWEVGALNYSTGLPTEDLSRIRAKNYNMILPNTTYYFFDPTYGGNINVFWYDINKDFIKISGWTGNKAITSPNNAYYFKFIMASSYGTTYNHNISINYPATITSYKSYSGTTIFIDWTTEAGTVYGGYVDLVTGEIVAEWKYVTIDEKYYTYISGDQYRGTNCTNVWFDMGSNKWDYNVSYVISNINGDVTKCESFKLISMPIWNNPDLYPWHYVLNNINQVHCVFDNTTVGITSEDTNAEAITKIKAWVHDHPIKMAYRLAKAKQVSYPLTPAQIKTLSGTNNIWSNANGNIELKYWSH